MGIKRGVLELNSRAMVNLEIRNMVGLSVFGSIEWACESFVNWEGGKIRWTINFSTKKKKNSFDRHLCHFFPSLSRKYNGTFIRLEVSV